MTDRELLELAAKAGAIRLDHYNDLKDAYWIDDVNQWWNPLTDDGDALRLAVKLGLDIECHGCLTTFPYAVAYDCERNITEEEQPGDCDPYAATRRAIVRAAAEIGKWMR